MMLHSNLIFSRLLIPSVAHKHAGCKTLTHWAPKPPECSAHCTHLMWVKTEIWLKTIPEIAVGVITTEFIKHSWSGETRKDERFCFQIPRGKSFCPGQTAERCTIHTNTQWPYWSIRRIITSDTKHITHCHGNWWFREISPIHSNRVKCLLFCTDSVLLYKSLRQHLLWMKEGLTRCHLPPYKNTAEIKEQAFTDRRSPRVHLYMGQTTKNECKDRLSCYTWA